MDWGSMILFMSKTLVEPKIELNYYILNILFSLNYKLPKEEVVGNLKKNSGYASLYFCLQ